MLLAGWEEGHPACKNTRFNAPYYQGQMVNPGLPGEWLLNQCVLYKMGRRPRFSSCYSVFYKVPWIVRRSIRTTSVLRPLRHCCAFCTHPNYISAVCVSTSTPMTARYTLVPCSTRQHWLFRDSRRVSQPTVTGCQPAGWNPNRRIRLGSSLQLSQISITDIPLQSTTIRVAKSACDLGVVIDSKCHCEHTWRPSVGLVSTTCANSAQWSDHWHMKQQEH